ncbi:MAG: hypothetical protein WCK58_07010 [Chloroflexota bacterium]
MQSSGRGAAEQGTGRLLLAVAAMVLVAALVGAMLGGFNPFGPGGPEVTPPPPTPTEPTGLLIR